MIRVEIAFALPARQEIERLTLAEGSTIADALAHSTIKRSFPELDGGDERVGIFGRLAALQTELRDGDRIEIYRPLISDPKAGRRRRAAKTGG